LATKPDPNVTDAELAYLWQLMGETLALIGMAAPGYEIHLSSGAALILSQEMVADFNCILIDSNTYAEKQLREYDQIIRTKNIPYVALLTERVADEVTPIAQELGLQYVEKTPLMIYHPQALHTINDKYQVEQVKNEHDLITSNRIIASAFELPFSAVNRAYGVRMLDLPGVSVFFAKNNGIPISSVITAQIGTSIGIWAMATDPEHIRQGAGNALLSYVINYHYSRGATIFYLSASSAGKRLYENIGFRKVSNISFWIKRNTI
jgi:GNAT superfamily N-acetyltransferase